MVDLPKRKVAIGLKWVYRIKYNPDGNVQKHKVWLVVKGYAQQPAIDYFETFSPVIRMETVRIILALAAHNKWMVYQFMISLDLIRCASMK